MNQFTFWKKEQVPVLPTGFQMADFHNAQCKRRLDFHTLTSFLSFKLSITSAEASSVLSLN